MEIRFMKRDALNTLKGSLKKIFTNYFIKKSPSWIEEKEVLGKDPFIKFRRVPDFQLISPKKDGMTIGKIEIENSKLVYQNLRLQAADERLWAGLCHSEFYDYVRQRFEYETNKTAYSTTDEDDDDEIKKLTSNDKEIARIENRFFFSRKHSREQLLTNPIARYWWTGRAFYDDADKNFKRLDLIGENDFYTKIFSTMTRSFAANRDILNGVVKCFEHFEDKGITLDAKKHLRPALIEINKVGGAVVLDCLTEDEIAAIMIERIEKILSKNTFGF